ncbi:MAG: GxxExxY protein [Acidobacteria bacterium]|nr:GxxExxY protein [Acidobacteriota bacterium]MBI3489204.1 GxxExxY protein [Acidobacteriota bacterium]
MGDLPQINTDEHGWDSVCEAIIGYDGMVVGEYVADRLVPDSVIAELKCLNYLRATGLRTGLILNFHFPKVGVKRVSL